MLQNNIVYVGGKYLHKSDDITNGCMDLTGLDFGLCTMALGIGYVNGECSYVSGCEWILNGIDYSDAFFDTIEECEAICGIENLINLGDVNFDGEINVLDVVLLVSFILTEETNELEYVASDLNEDGFLNVLDIVLLIDMILNPQPFEECNIIPEVGPCDGICPTYYFNQDTNQCEEFITGCCGIEAFDIMEECLDFCE